MLRILSSHTVADVEESIDLLRNSIGQSLQLPLSLPFGGAFGLSALLVQLIARWHEINDGSRCINLAREFATSAETRDRFVATIHGMAGTYFCDLISSGEQSVSRQIGMRAMARYVLAMANENYRETTRGIGTFLCCFQGAKEENEYLSSLYAIRDRGKPASDGEPETITVHNTAGFSKRLRDILSTQVKGAVERFGPDSLDLLGSLVYQLFKNADVHTVKDENGNGYSRSLRGLIVRHVAFQSLSDLNDYVSGDNHLRVFLTRTGTAPSNNPKASHSYLEISVVDTGPGLALRWLSLPSHGGIKTYVDLDIEDEFAAVKKCFEVHATTYPRGHHGDGLVIALEALKELNAFVTMRTGRLSLYQDFSRADTAAFRPGHRFPDKHQLAPIAGTSYVICVPIPDR